MNFYFKHKRYLQKCQGGGPGLPYTGSVGATAPTYSIANFFKMTFAIIIKMNIFNEKINDNKL